MHQKVESNPSAATKEEREECIFIINLSRKDESKHPMRKEPESVFSSMGLGPEKGGNLFWSASTGVKEEKLEITRNKRG